MSDSWSFQKKRNQVSDIFVAFLCLGHPEEISSNVEKRAPLPTSVGHERRWPRSDGRQPHVIGGKRKNES